MHNKQQNMHLVLDAMGVIYKTHDDVRELLVPFIKEKGGITDTEKIEELYYHTSLGKWPSYEFWRSVHIDYNLEDEYLSLHKLSDGLIEFIAKASSIFRSISCLSNDVSEWSKKLRDQFQLDRYISKWFISADLKRRKPSYDIYKMFIEKSGYRPSETIFVDDREKNLQPARKLGFRVILFNPDCSENTRNFLTINNLNDLFTTKQYLSHPT